jgi:SpoVK/Ycf46/Vps4 family AAA+-type ATPase
MKVVASPTFVELGGAAVLSDGLAAFKKVLEDKDQLVNGGTLFIDEMYQLSPKTDKSGAQIVNYLLKAMEDMRDRIVVIVAGYSDQARSRRLLLRCVRTRPFPSADAAAACPSDGRAVHVQPGPALALPAPLCLR